VTSKPFDEFYDYLVGEEGLEPRSAANYRNSVRKAYEHDLEEPWRILERKKLQRRTRASYRAALLKWARWGDLSELEERLLSPSVKKLLRDRKARPDKVITPLNEEQVQAFLAVLDEYEDQDPLWVWPCLRMVVKLGLRAGADLTRIRRDSVEEAMESGVLRIWTKRSKQRDLPASLIIDELHTLLLQEQWAELCDLISPGASEATRPQAAYESVRRWTKRLAKAAGIAPDEVWTHRFRHTAADYLYEQAGDILAVRDLLGHSSTATTERYLRGRRTKRVAEAMKGRFDNEEG